jgi:hypothetical protein
MRPELFKTTLCAHYMANNSCPFGEGCHYAHGLEEMREKVEQPQENGTNEGGEQ